MHYIILTHSISGIVGSMPNVYNKYHYLVEHGFDCIIVSGRCDGEVLVSWLKRFRNNIFPEINEPINCFSNATRNKVINNIAKLVGGGLQDRIHEFS